MKFIGFTLSMMLMAAAVEAAPLPVQQPGAGVNSNPLGNPVRRINPNSRQGTVPSNPAQPRPWQGRPPTLENGGIGNGQRFPAPAPAPRSAQPNDRQ
jgi:hypothetical protein